LLACFTAWVGMWRTAADEHAAELQRALVAASAWRTKMRRPTVGAESDSTSACGESGDSRGHSSGSEDEGKADAGLALAAPPASDCGPYMRGRLSCLMAKVLRHTAASYGLQLGADGFVPVAKLLVLEPFAEIDAKLCDVECVVEFERREGKKQRFSMRHGLSGPEIRANQGHSAAAVDGVLVTREAKLGDLPACVLHGTYLKHARQIVREGLRPMGRHHVHLFIEEAGVGRKGAEVIVHVDVARAQAAGVTFLISDNNVVLTSGGPEGAIPSACFSKMVRVHDGALLHDLDCGEAPNMPARAYVPPHLRKAATTTQRSPRYQPPQRRSSTGSIDRRMSGIERGWAGHHH